MSTPIPVVLDVELSGGRWDGHRERGNALAPPPALRYRYRYSHDE
ncbi:hypothetical protein [Kitasatospora sp. NPDC050543]